MNLSTLDITWSVKDSNLLLLKIILPSLIVILFHSPTELTLSLNNKAIIVKNQLYIKE